MGGIQRRKTFTCERKNSCESPPVAILHITGSVTERKLRDICDLKGGSVSLEFATPMTSKKAKQSFKERKASVLGFDGKHRVAHIAIRAFRQGGLPRRIAVRFSGGIHSFGEIYECWSVTIRYRPTARRAAVNNHGSHKLKLPMGSYKV